jgi:hypothetical protein
MPPDNLLLNQMCNNLHKQFFRPRLFSAGDFNLVNVPWLLSLGLGRMSMSWSLIKRRTAFDQKGQVFSLKVHWRGFDLKILFAGNIQILRDQLIFTRLLNL